MLLYRKFLDYYECCYSRARRLTLSSFSFPTSLFILSPSIAERCFVPSLGSHIRRNLTLLITGEESRLAKISLHHTIIQIRRQTQNSTIEADQDDKGNREKRIVNRKSIAQRLKRQC